MVEKDCLLRELDQNQDRLREARVGRDHPGFSTTTLLLAQPLPDTEQVFREELKVGPGLQKYVMYSCSRSPGIWFFNHALAEIISFIKDDIKRLITPESYCTLSYKGSCTPLSVLQSMQEELKQAHRLAEMYREQCVTLETDLAQIREEGDVGREIFKVMCVRVPGHV